MEQILQSLLDKAPLELMEAVWVESVGFGLEFLMVMLAISLVLSSTTLQLGL